DMTLVVRSASGEEPAPLTSATPVRDPSGRLVGAVAVFQDITQLKRAEEELARLTRSLATERSQLQTILDSASNAIIYLDAETDLLRANPEAERLFGHPISPEDGREPTVGQILDSEGRVVPWADLPGRRALRGETPGQVELAVVRPDGGRVPVVENAAPTRGTDGEGTGAV